MSGSRILPRPKTELERTHARRKKGTGSSAGIELGSPRHSKIAIPDPLPLDDKRWLNQNTKDLAKALLSLNTEEEMQFFLRDLLTSAEIKEFGIRWKAARMLASGESYTKIGFATYLSSRTIARIRRWIAEGMGGYQLALRRLTQK